MLNKAVWIQVDSSGGWSDAGNDSGQQMTDGGVSRWGEADGCLRMVADGCSWWRMAANDGVCGGWRLMVADGSRWQWMAADDGG